MAGTGKSTIARTVAQSFSLQQKLGASFFFKKGEGDRGNASRFFTTIATDLMRSIPGMKDGIREAIDLEPSIAEKTLEKQFHQLICQPFLGLKDKSALDQSPILVIDALDECDREGDVKMILRLFSQAREILPISLRIFVTSRPELPVRLGFKHLPDGIYQDMVLHEVAAETISSDIRLFFDNELAIIRERWSLNASWPEEQDIETLVRLSVPFFVFAATICRFLGEDCHNPRRQLADILRYKTEDIPEQDATYLPNLNHLFPNQSERGREKISQEFREVVGPIVVLRSPLSVTALANLLDLAVEDVRCRLDSLHSVLHIPSDEKQPIRLLHLSFRDFLVDPEKRGRSPFWIDEQETNGRIARKCLELLSGQNGLRQNICNLSRLGDPVPEVDNQMVNASLSSELQYACHYWVSHIRQSKRNISDHSLILRFLLNHALHWLEVASIMGDVSGTIIAIKNLLLYASVRHSCI